MNSITIGTCSLCSGRVSVPTAWYGTKKPTPTCEKCKAVTEQSYGPTIKMKSVVGIRTKVPIQLIKGADGMPVLLSRSEE